MAKATRVQDLSISVDTYEDNGKKKYRRVNIGSIWKRDDGEVYATMDVMALNPTLALLNAKATRNAGNNVIISIFDVEPRDKSPSAGPASGDEPF